MHTINRSTKFWKTIDCGLTIWFSNNVEISLVIGVEVVEIVSLLVSILDGWNCIGRNVLVVFVGILGLLEVVSSWLLGCTG